MKNNRLLKFLVLSCAFLVLVGCKKDKNTITEYIGIVVEGTEQTGLPDVKVSVTNDEGRRIAFTSTDEKGAFSMFVNFEKVTDGCYLLIDGSPELPFQKKYELKGMGKNKYDYGSLPLFNKSKTTVETNEVTEKTANSAVCGGVITCGADVHIVERGVCWSKSSRPVITPDGSSQTSDGEGSGSFLSYLRGLEEKTEYFVRAYAKTKEGVLVYDEGPEVKFTTKAFITAKRVTDIDVLAGSAKCGGIIAAENDNVVLERGVCWATHENPKIENDPHTSDGQGNGEFFSDITGLQEQTTYYVRAYARTESTVKYAATDPLSFTTPALLPTFQHDGTTYYVHPEAGTMTWQTAMDFCDGLTFAGYSDWFLPNKVELNAMYFKQNEIGGFVTTGNDCKYWSSTEYGYVSNPYWETCSWGQDFSDGTQVFIGNSLYLRVRPVRKDGGSGGGTTPTTPTVVTIPAPTVTSNSATCGGNVTSDGGATIIQRGICYSTSQSSVLTGTKVPCITNGTGNYTCSLTGLSASTRYYYCAYAINSEGTSHGSVEHFDTSSGAAVPPTVTTKKPTDITPNSATCSGRVTDDGGAIVSQRGICYSTEHNPDISSPLIEYASTGGTGTFYCDLSNLSPNTTYFVRAFAINSAGPGYGLEIAFKTEIDYPTVTTGTYNATNTSVVCYGNVVSDGGSPIIERGICYSGSFSVDPMSGMHIPEGGTSIGSFSCQITNLMPGTQYYYRAYATNSKGTDYGDKYVFTTSGGHVEGWLQYDNGYGTDALGFEEGGTLYWANMFPSSMLSSYEGTSVTKVEAYLNMAGVYTLRLYSGGATSPGSLIYQHNFNHNNSSAVWATMTLPEAVSLNTSQNLWVVISVTHSAGEFPAGCCQNTGNPNGRWYSDGVEWGDVENYTWGMHTFVSNGVKGEIQIGDKQPMGITHLKKKANVDKYHGIKSIKRRQ